MGFRHGKKPNGYLDEKKDDIRKSLAKTRHIRTTALQLGIIEQTLRCYLRVHPELLPDGMVISSKGPVYSIPKERIVELLRKHTIQDTAQILGVAYGTLSAFLCKHPDLRPPEIEERKHARGRQMKDRPKYRPEIEDRAMSTKGNNPTGLQLFAAFKTINALETRLKKEWDVLLDEYFILMVLSKSKEPVESLVLAKALSVTATRMSRHLASLEKKNCVKRAMGAVDKRTMVFSITPEGIALLKKIESGPGKEALK